MPYAIARGLAYISGQAPVRGGRHVATGRVGAEVAIKAAQAAARLCGLNILARLKSAVAGDWPRIRRCVRICGYVSPAPRFSTRCTCSTAVPT